MKYKIKKQSDNYIVKIRKFLIFWSTANDATGHPITFKEKQYAQNWINARKKIHE